MYPSLPGLLSTLWVCPYFTDRKNETGAEKPIVWCGVFTKGQSLSGPKPHALDSEESWSCVTLDKSTCASSSVPRPLSMLALVGGEVGGLAGREEGAVRDADPQGTARLSPKHLPWDPIDT